MHTLIDITKEITKGKKEVTAKLVFSKINGDYYQIDTAVWTTGNCPNCEKALADWNVICVSKDELKPLYDSLKELFES